MAFVKQKANNNWQIVTYAINIGDYPLDKDTFPCDTLTMKTQPSLFEHFKKFNTEIACIRHFERIRWPHGPRCPKCKGKRISQFEADGKTGKERHLYECMDCSYQYSVTSGTVFHDSHIPLNKWFLAIYMICSAKKGIS